MATPLTDLESAEIFATPPNDGVQACVDESLADWDPLQGGYQAIIDIFEEARSRIAVWESQPNFYEPERAGPMYQTGSAGIREETLLDVMPPPQRYRRVSKNSFAG